MKIIKQYLKDSFLGRKVIHYYTSFLNWLSRHKGVPRFFAHGGLHLLFLLLCILGGIYLYGEIDRYNQRTLRQFSFRIDGDTMGNYKLSHLEIYVFKDERIPTVDNIRYIFQLGYKDSLNYKTEECKLDPYKGKKIDAVHKISLVAEDTIYKERSNENQIYIKYPNKYTPENTAKFGKDLTLSKQKSESYWWFTNDDDIKKDNIEYSLRNLTNNWEGDNPYFCCFYGIHAIRGSYNLDSTSKIVILYNPFPYDEHSTELNSHNDLYEKPPMTIEKIYPQPTFMDLNVIVYNGRDVEYVLDQGGVYVTAIDPDKKNHADRMEMLWTVLLGTIIAFSLDIIVQLILKWRKLKEYKKENAN